MPWFFEKESIWTPWVWRIENLVKIFWPWLDWREYQTNGPFFVAKSQWSWWTTLLVGGICFPLLVKERDLDNLRVVTLRRWTCVRLHLVEPIPPPIERGSRCKILKCGPLSEDSRPPFYKIYCGIENFGPDIYAFGNLRERTHSWIPYESWTYEE